VQCNLVNLWLTRISNHNNSENNNFSNNSHFLLTSVVFLFALVVIVFISFFNTIFCPPFVMAELLNNEFNQNHNNNNINNNNKDNAGKDDSEFHTVWLERNTIMAADMISPATTTTTTTTTAAATLPQKSSPLYTPLSLTNISISSNNGKNTTRVAASTAAAVDSDRDGLTDIEEIDTFRTNINTSDSDKDRLSDGKEVNGWFWFVEERRGCINATLTITCHVHKTNPLSPDTDGDRNSDYYEYITFGSDPTDPDQDKDGILDGLESGPNALYHTSFFAADTDRDGMSDGQEIKTEGRDPTKPDTGLAEEQRANDAPIANPQRAVTLKNNPVDIYLTGSDKDGDSLYFFIAAYPLHGTTSTLMVTGSNSAKLTYIPVPGYVGDDSFTFWAYDGKAYSSAPSRVSIYVSP
jgi:Bacterial Ig domain